MLKSMTGFGTYKNSNENYEIKVDIKSVNNRYLDIQIKGPKSIIFLEDELKKIISNKVNRGKIDVFIDIKYLNKKSSNFQIDEGLLENYLENISKINKIINSDTKISAIDLLKYDNSILSLEKTELSEDDSFVEICRECVDLASTKFLEMKLQEGYNIQYDLNKKLKELSSIVEKIDAASENIVENNVYSLKSRVLEILDSMDVKLDNDRLTNEIVFYTDRLSIDEELVRLKSHIELFDSNLNDDNSNGKKMDFIIQELNRESNTIGSKSSNSEITNDVINMKSIIEKMREQVQNIE